MSTTINLYLYANKKIITNKDGVIDCKRILIRPGNRNPSVLSSNQNLYPKGFSITEVREIIDKLPKPIKIIFMDFNITNFDISLLNQIIMSSKVKGILLYNNAYVFERVLTSCIMKSVNIKTLTFKYQQDSSLKLITSIINHISSSDLKIGFKFKNTEIMNILHVSLLTSIVNLTNLHKLYIDGGILSDVIPDLFVKSLIECPNLTKISLPVWSRITPDLVFKIMLKPNLNTFRFRSLGHFSKDDITKYYEIMLASRIEKIVISDLVFEYIGGQVLVVYSISDYLLKIKFKQIFGSTTLPNDSINKVIETCNLNKENAISITNKLQTNIINKYRRESSLVKLCSDYVYKHCDGETVTGYSEVLLH